jgi:hypothetical protein
MRGLSGMRGVVLGAGLGVLAAKKVPPLVQQVRPRVQKAMLKYVVSHAATGATDQVPSTDKVAGGSSAA